MKKSLTILAAGILSVGLMAGSAMADSNGNGADHSNKGNSAAAGKSAGVKANVDVSATVTSATYDEHGHQGYTGLLKAIENVQDKPAGATIADLLLTKYSVQLSADQKAQLEAIQDKAAALSTAADVLVDQGNVTDAVYAEKDAIHADLKNLDLYKKLGKLYDKLGKTGVKLYVDGDEPSFEVAPFIRDGSTLVPFRAISEALKATVTWDPAERSVTVTRDGTTVKLYIDSKTAYVNGQEVTLEVPAAIENGSTVVPVRFISEALKATVKWEGETQTVVIYQD